MLANTLLSKDLFPFKRSDKCSKATELMNEWGVSHLPVVTNDKIEGYVAAEDIAFPADEEDVLARYLLNKVQFKVGDKQHIFEILKVFALSELSTLSVVDEEDRFVGIISFKDLFRQLGECISFKENGSVITLRLAARDYSLSEISRLIESNNYKVLGLLIRAVPDSENQVDVMIKLNRTDIKSLLATFSRFSYNVSATDMTDEDMDYIRDRFASFMKYLDI